jgi:Domain of unknown function (DUF4924)
MHPLVHKRNQNIAGYVIGMWFVEEMLRACGMDKASVRERLVAPMQVDDNAKAEMQAWYMDLIDRMYDEGVEERGHLQELDQILQELQLLHDLLIGQLEDEDYLRCFQKAEDDVRNLIARSKGGTRGVVEACFTGVYGTMLLRTQGKRISKATTDAERHLRALLNSLSAHYKDMHRLPGVSLN